MKILMISLDRSLFDASSPSSRRMLFLSEICEELHIIIPNKKSDTKKGVLKIGEKISVHPTDSASKLFFVCDIIAKGKKILASFGERGVVTAQEPFEIGFAAWVLAKKFKAALEIQMHGDFYGSQYWRGENFLNRLRSILGKFILRRADVVRVVSRRLEDSIKTFVQPEKILRLPIYFDETELSGGINLKEKYPEANPIILSVGNLVPVKNHKLLIESFAEIKKELPSAKLIIAGDGPLRNDLELQAISYKLQDDVVFLGAQKGLAETYKSADIFVLPSLYEGWGRAVIEAAYFGLPIVMTDVGLAGEVIIDGESGIVVPPTDGKKLKEAILRVVKDDGSKNRLMDGVKLSIGGLLAAKNDSVGKIKAGWAAALK